MTRKIQMADVVRAHMEVRGCPVLTSNQCYAIAMNLNCQIGAPTPSQPIYDEAKERELFEAFYSKRAKTLPLPLGSLIRYGGGQYVNDFALFGWMVWLECAQSRAKAVEVGHE